MGFRNPAGDRQAQSCATIFVGPRRAILNVIEPLENIWLGVKRNAISRISHENVEPTRMLQQRELYRRALWRVLDGVIKQIEQHLPEKALIAPVGNFSRNLELKCYALSLREDGRCAYRLLD